MQIKIINVQSGRIIVLEQLLPSSTIGDLKKIYAAKYPNCYVERQQYKLSVDKNAKGLKDSCTFEDLNLTDGGSLYFKDLGPQIDWKTVFLFEYSGPLVIYLTFFATSLLKYDRLYGIVNIVAACWTFHYAKRLYETVCVHRFSHSTMPIRNLFKNCSYYWGFAALIAYSVNHPLYTPPYFGSVQVGVGLMLFFIGEMGNYSIHLALRDLRSFGTKERKIPIPTSNIFTILFNYVSCPNYTYELVSWIGFTILSQSLPAFLFMVAGLYQMLLWALGKHRNYIKEFKDYPKQRKAILPLLI